jgi:hypothetical protein
MLYGPLQGYELLITKLKSSTLLAECAMAACHLEQHSNSDVRTALSTSLQEIPIGKEEPKEPDSCQGNFGELVAWRKSERSVASCLSRPTRSEEPMGAFSVPYRCQG